MTDKKPQQVTAIAVVKPQDYNLDEVKGTEISTSFQPMVAVREELAKEFKEIIALDVTAETCHKAGDLRRKFVKVRTGIAAIHKDQKAFFLSGGRFADALKNLLTTPVVQMETELRDIEEHFANLEFELREKLCAARTEDLRKYEVDDTAIPAGLGAMTCDVWNNYLAGVIASYKQRKEAERIAEAGRKAKEAAEAKEVERVRVENEELRKTTEEARKKADAAEAQIVAERKATAAAEEKRKAAEAKKAKALAARKAAELKKVKDAAAAKEAEAAAKLESEQIAATAKLVKERKAREALEAEKKLRDKKDADQAEADRRQHDEDTARLQDDEHRDAVNLNIVHAMMEACPVLDSTMCDMTITAILNGDIPNVTINY